MTASHPGLDLEQLRAIAGRRHAATVVPRLLDRVADHLDRHDGYVSWSGGKDSTVVVDLARQVDPHVPVVFFDSGLQFPETYQYLEERAREWRLNYHVIAAEPDLLTVLIALGGFDHDAPDRHLSGVELADLMIKAPAAQAHRLHGPGALWGVRAEESSGRRALYRQQLAARSARRSELGREAARTSFGGVIERVDGTVTYGPIWDWQRPQVFGYLAGRDIEPNPVYGKLASLGMPDAQIRVDSILDASKLSNGHVAWLQKGWPEIFDRLAIALPRLREYT